MTGLVHPTTDDIQLPQPSPPRPLDFTNLLSYPSDQLFPSLQTPPSNFWSSPLSVSGTRVPPDPLNWLGSTLSPLFRPVNVVPPADEDATTASTGLWPLSASSEEENDVKMQFAFENPFAAADSFAVEQQLPVIAPTPAPAPVSIPVSELAQPALHNVPSAVSMHSTVTVTNDNNVSNTSPTAVQQLPALPSKSEPEPEPQPKPAKKPALTRKTSQTLSSIDKAAERRRKNRESSSRCYYNRKRIIETLDRQISQEKSKLTALYDRALELRHENARLKKDVVTNGIALPTKGRQLGTGGVRYDSAFQLRGYLQLLQSASYRHGK